MHIELQGQLERITFRNEENNYTIAKIKIPGRKDPVTIIGSLIPVTPGEILKLKGTWDMHPKYGEQFKFTSCETIMPATVKGIEKYLGSGLIKGIGPVIARRIVSKFGNKTLDVIETDINRLKEVDGIGEKRIEMISTAWIQQKEIRDIMLFLQGHEVSSTHAAKIFRHYGKDSIKIVQANPYRLATDIFGIGFKTADSIAEKLGIPKESLIRAEAGILYVLQQMSDEGHVFYPYEMLIEKCREILSISEDIIKKAMQKLNTDKKIIIEGNSVFLIEFHIAETGIATYLKSLMQFPKSLYLSERSKIIDIAQRGLNIKLAENQIQAVLAAIENKLLVITGGPGTGKTTIIKAIIKIFRHAGQSILLAAPTGRASKRMTEATGHEAKTIHRMLEFSPKDGSFKKNDKNKLEANLIILDEASMIDTILMYHMLKAIPNGATLILVGDIDQLPSVGAGNILKDLIESDQVPTVRLNEIFRQSHESLIIQNAHRINKGEFPVFKEERHSLHDFYFIEIEDPEKVLEMIINLCCNRIPDKFKYDPVDDIQILTPMHKGIIGSANLNTELQKHLNKSRDEIVRGGKIFKKGDKVMQVRNNYDKDVFNGDIGKIQDINMEEQNFTVDYDGKIVEYDFNELEELVLAYAISVHKSQGSEYPVVILPLLTQHYMLLQRNLLYTAVTRGKKLVIIIGTKKALAIALKNNKTQTRYTKLKERLQNSPLFCMIN